MGVFQTFENYLKTLPSHRPKLYANKTTTIINSTISINYITYLCPSIIPKTLLGVVVLTS